MTLRSLSLVLAVAGLTAACGGGSSGTPTATGSGPAAGGGNTVTIKNFAFSPAALSVAKGTAVTFTNEDTAAHTATADAGASVMFDTGTLNPGGGSGTVTFSTAGQYAYHCSIHQYMKGSVTVTP